MSELLAVLKAILKANDDFRLGMPDDWEGDPLQDACDDARSIVARAEAKMDRRTCAHGPGFVCPICDPLDSYSRR